MSICFPLRLILPIPNLHFCFLCVHVFLGKLLESKWHASKLLLMMAAYTSQTMHFPVKSQCHFSIVKKCGEWEKYLIYRLCSDFPSCKVFMLAFSFQAHSLMVLKITVQAGIICFVLTLPDCVELSLLSFLAFLIFFSFFSLFLFLFVTLTFLKSLGSLP